MRFETVRELVACKWNEIFLFLVTKVTSYFCFSKGVNSIRSHESLLLVLRTCFKEMRLFTFETVLTFTIVSAGNDCFVLVACKYNGSFYFLVTKCNLTLLFFTRE